MVILNYIALEEDSNRIEKLNNLRFLTNQEFFDNITLLASAVSHCPYAGIKIIKPKDYYLKSLYNATNIDFINPSTEERTIYNPTEYTSRNPEHSPLLINNIHKHEIFKNYYYVQNAPFIKFYCGFPLYSIENESIGCICIADDKPRKLSKNIISCLDTLTTISKQFIAISPHHFPSPILPSQK